MSNCQKLWTIWFITYLIVINTYLTVVSIKDYLDFKYQILDIAYGGNWDMSSIYVILCCLNFSLGLLPIIIYMSVVNQGNLANDGHVLGRDVDSFHLIVNEHGKGMIIPTVNKKSSFCTNPVISLILMELPPLSYFLQVISAICFLIPRSIMEGHRIYHGVYKSNHIWHSDLDFIFDPDQQHYDFVREQNDNYVQPMSVAYFNLGLSLVLLSLQYSRVLWHISRKFTIILSFVMIVFSCHFLVEYCSVSILIKVALNPLIVSEQLQVKLSAFTIIFLSLTSNIILLLSFTTVFHYGLLQYADFMFHRNRKTRRQMLNSSPQMIGSNHLDIPGAFSPSVSENNYSESSIEPFFSKSHMSHIVAICCLGMSTSLKFTNIYFSFVHLYQTTSDLLTLVNMLISVLFIIIWLILWFALALRRTWNFKIKSETKFVAEPLFLNGNPVPNQSGTMQLHQLQNSLLRNTKLSEMNLSKQDMMALNRNAGLDGGSDDTDMSSKLSSNNYVFLQSMRNGQMGFLDTNGQPPMLRNPLYLSYAVNNQGLPTSNAVYANDDSINNRSIHIEDQMGSEHSYNSNRSRNIGFENMPPILPTFDENRYKSLNPNSVAMEKLIPRYLRNPSLDYNSSVHFAMPNNEYMQPTVTMAPISSYNYDNGVTNYSTSLNARYKQAMTVGNGRDGRPGDKYITAQPMVGGKSSGDQCEEDQESQRRMQTMFNDPRRMGKSPVMFATVEEVVADTLVTESDSLLPGYSDRDPASGHEQTSQSNNTNNNDSERMCSQV